MSKPQLFPIDPNADQRPMSQNQALLEHGTVLNTLKPQNLVQAAIADLKLALRKDKGLAAEDKPYSFARRHVRKANSAVHLLAIALFEKRPQTDKRSTMIVYGDRELLRQALINELTEMGEWKDEH